MLGNILSDEVRGNHCKKFGPPAARAQPSGTPHHLTAQEWSDHTRAGPQAVGQDFTVCCKAHLSKPLMRRLARNLILI